MRSTVLHRTRFWGLGILTITLFLGLATGCKHQQSAARTDQQIAAEVQAKLQGEGALVGQNIQVSVVNGVASLSGTVTDEASRSLAGNDSGTVSGVKTVVNNLTVQPAQMAMATPAAQPVPVPASTERAVRDKQSRHDRDMQQAAPAPVVQQKMAQTVVPSRVQAPPPPPEPPKPVIKQVTLSAGTVLPVRLTEELDSKTAQSNDAFHGSVAGDIGTQGVIAIPHGSPVMGRIVDAKEAAHFKGSSLLTIELTQVTARGKKITLVTDTFSKEGAARGKNTATKAGGGAAFGAIIGALAGGGKGAVIGGLAGGAAGTGVNAATRGEQVVIPSETLINFRLQSPITITVTIPPAGSEENGVANDPQLQRR
jgi:hypothetical protein